MDNVLDSLDMTNYVDFKLVILLLAIGFMIKHFLPKVPNYAIPIILMLLSLTYCLLMNVTEFNLYNCINAITDAIISAAIAIGLHSSGKGLFRAANSLNDAKREVAQNITENLLGDDEEEEDE